MFDPYVRYSSKDALKVPIGKRLTHVTFEETIRSFFNESLKWPVVDFDLTQVEWVSLFELLLLIQWIHRLENGNIDVRVFFPYDALLHGLDETEPGSLFEKSQLTPMHRRDRVKSFLLRLGVPKEIERVSRRHPVIFHKGQVAYPDPTTISFDDVRDPYDAKLLRVTPFMAEDDLNADRTLSNKQLRKLLKDHSCLDPVDSGMLADVVIEELASNALIHGLAAAGEHQCAWVSARLVKSSWRAMEEVPDWLARVYKALLGRSYIELAICDSGSGIYQRLRDHIPSWRSPLSASIKAVLDYAFDKFSSSVSAFRTELDSLPRGLFWVYDLVRQYGGLLLVRSGGYFMAYDFLNRNYKPRLLNINDERGCCTDVGGTAIQIVLPESKGLFITAPPVDLCPPLKEPDFFEVDPPDVEQVDLDEYAKGKAVELEKICQGRQEVPVIVSLADLDHKNLKDMYLMARMIRYVLYLENPNILWLLGPRDCNALKSINQFLVSGDKSTTSNCVLSEKLLEDAFRDISSHDRRICPMLLPSGNVLWLGADTSEAQNLNLLWNAGEVELSDFGDDAPNVLQMAKANPHLISTYVSKSRSSQINMALHFGLYDCVHSLVGILKEKTEHVIRATPGTMHSKGCYHLPYGKYSHHFLYLKPLLIQPSFVRRMARYLLTTWSLLRPRDDIDIIVGGTHSARKLILAISDELDAEGLTIDRYVDQIEDPAIDEKVQGKRALIVSDVVSSGSFASTLVRRLLHAGCDVKAICSICDLREDGAETISEIPIVSLFHFPVRRFPKPDRTPVYEVNPISLRPTILEDERDRSRVPSLVDTDQFIKWVSESQSLVPGHIVLGPTHYAYFVDTKQLLNRYAEEIFGIVVDDMEKQLKTKGFSTQYPAFLVTADRSNAELFFPELVRKRFPKVSCMQVDRIRPSKAGIWQLDRLDRDFVPVEDIEGSAVLIWDDGSNTGGTLMQLLEVVSEFQPKFILAYCLINRLPLTRSLFLSRIGRIGQNSDVKIRFVANVPAANFVRSDCPICNRYRPRLPPIKEIKDYWNNEEKLAQEYKWSHICAPRVAESVRGILESRVLCNIDEFLSEVFRVRCILGNFENQIGVIQDERQELSQLLNDDMALAATCFVLNREPRLLSSVVDYQIPSFHDDLTQAILRRTQGRSCDDIIGKQDILHFISVTSPDFVCDYFSDFVKGLICSRQQCVIFVSMVLTREDLSIVIDLLQKLSLEIDRISKEYAFMPFLRGLCDACKLWYQTEKETSFRHELYRAISDLQILFRPRHEGAAEYRRLLDRIIDYIQLIQKSAQDSHYEDLFTIIYNDWRELVERVITEQLVPAIYAMKDILEFELTSRNKRYYLSANEGLRYDCLMLQRWLSELKETDIPKLIIEECGEKIKKTIKRLVTYLFDIQKSQLAILVNGIPVDVFEHLRNTFITNSPWIDKAGITQELDQCEDYIPGFMTRRMFKRILDEIFMNIKRHNFSINEDADLSKLKHTGGTIAGKIKTEESKIEILIRSNGSREYDGSVGFGIRRIRDICKAFNAEYRIDKSKSWVENRIILQRW